MLGGVGGRRQGCFQDRGSGEEQAPVRLECDHLARGEVGRRIGLDEVPVRVEPPSLDGDLVRLAHHMQDHRRVRTDALRGVQDYWSTETVKRRDVLTGGGAYAAAAYTTPSPTGSPVPLMPPPGRAAGAASALPRSPTSGRPPTRPVGGTPSSAAVTGAPAQSPSASPGRPFLSSAAATATRPAASFSPPPPNSLASSPGPRSTAAGTPSPSSTSSRPCACPRPAALSRWAPTSPAPWRSRACCRATPTRPST